MRAFCNVVLFLFMFGLITLFSALAVIRPGTCGVPVRLGAVSDTTLDEGIHVVAPFVTRVERVNLKIQKNNLEADAATKDLQDVKAEIAINFNVLKA